MAYDFNNPRKEQNYETGMLASIREGFKRAALWYSADESDSNRPTGANRLNVNQLEQWTGSAWLALGLRYYAIAGTAALPSITRSGDTNTGIYFPADEVVAFTSAGTESARISAARNLLIGTTDDAPNARLHVNHGTGHVRFANGSTGYGVLQLGNSSTSANNWHWVSEGNGIAAFYQGAFGSGTARLSIGSGGTTLHRADNTQEGGQINWTRASDDAVLWSADCFGSGAAPAWRLFNSSERINVAGDGTTTVYGEGFFNTNKAGNSYLQLANSNAAGEAELKVVCNSGVTTNNSISRIFFATQKANSLHKIELFNNAGTSAPYLQWSCGSAVEALYVDMPRQEFRDLSATTRMRISGNGVEAVNGFVAGAYNASSNPAVMTKKLTGTTSATAGGVVNIAHGLADATKILGISVLIKPGGLDIYPPGDSIRSLGGPNPSVNYTYWIGLLNVSVQTASNANSEILGKPVTIWITYEV